MTPSICVFLAVLSLHSAPAHSKPLNGSSAQKVWMNDDIPWLRANAPISTFVSFSSVAPAPAAPNATYVKDSDPEWYRREISVRQGAIDADEAQIRSLRLARESGAGLSGTIPTEAPMTIDADSTILSLQRNIAALSVEIGSFEDMARQHSIAPGAIR